MSLPHGFPKGHSIKVQRDTESAAYVALLIYHEEGMRHAVQLSRAYGSTEQEAWSRSVDQAMNGKYNKL